MGLFSEQNIFCPWTYFRVKTGVRIKAYPRSFLRGSLRYLLSLGNKE